MGRRDRERHHGRAVDLDDAGLVAGSDAAAPSGDDAFAPQGRRQPMLDDRDGREETSWPEVDRRRQQPDRRNQPTSFLSSPFRRGRRKAGRRKGERDNIYVDVYSPTDVLIMLGIFILNIGDALFTLLWLQRGGGEGNPIMQAMLDIGVGAFLFQKCIVVGMWLLILTAHRNYRAARIGLWSALTIYTLLVMYHLVLVGFDVDPIVEKPQSTASVLQVTPESPEAGVSPMTPEQPAAGHSEMTPEQRAHGGLHAQDPLAERDGP